MILVDSSVWIDFLNGENSPQRHVLHRLINDKIKISVAEIIITEVLQGLKQEKDFTVIKTFFEKLHLHKPKGTDTYINAAKIYRNCRSKGKTIGSTVDCVIAAICIENAMPILHRDSDFDMIAACTALRVLKI